MGASWGGGLQLEAVIENVQWMQVPRETNNKYRIRTKRRRQRCLVGSNGRGGEGERKIRKNARGGALERGKQKEWAGEVEGREEREPRQWIKSESRDE